MFETKRLILREITEDDAEMIVKWRSDPAVYCYFYHPHKITVNEHLNWYRNKYLYDHNNVDFIAIEKCSERRIGVFGIVRSGQEAEVSYLLDNEYQKKGYASEAVNGLIEYAITKWKVKSITAGIHRNNHASIQLVKRLGFQLQKRQGDFLFYRKKVEYE